MARHTFRCPMRWSDMDAYQHVNNVMFLVYLEEARVDMLFHVAAEAGLSDLEAGIVVARHEIDYRRPLVYHPDGVDIDVWVTAIGGASFDLRYEVRDTATVFATAASVLVPYDMAAQRPRRLGSDERGFLERFRDA